MADRYTSRVAVTLAPGASSSTPHLIVRGGVATAPQLVLPDRMTTIQVDTVDATNLNCSNPGSAAATVIFWVEYRHSIQATPAMTAPGIFWKGGTGGGVGATIPFQNDYYFDPDATNDAAARLYNTVDAIMAAADTELPAGMGIVVHLHSAVNAADWADLDLATVPAGRSVTFLGDSTTGDSGIFIEGVCPASAAACNLAFRDCNLRMDAAATLGTNRSISLQNVTADLNAGSITMAAGTTFNAVDSVVSDPRVIGLGAGMLAVFLTRCSLGSSLGDVAPTIFTNSLLVILSSTTINIDESNWNMVSHAVGVIVNLIQCQAELENTGAGAALLASTPLTTIEVEDFVVSRAVNSGGGTINLGITAGNAQGGGYQSTNLRSVINGATTVSTTDGTILCDATAGTCALTMYDADTVPNGTRVEIKRIDAFAAGANDVTIAVPGANTIEGVAGPISLNTLVLDRPSVILEASNTGTGEWHIVATGGRATATDSTAVNGGLGGNATAQTANGIAAIAAGAATCVITNAYVTASSRVLVSLNFVDATATQILSVVPGAGSFTVTANAAATAKTQFSWAVLPG